MSFTETKKYCLKTILCPILIQNKHKICDFFFLLSGNLEVLAFLYNFLKHMYKPAKMLKTLKQHMSNSTCIRSRVAKQKSVLSFSTCVFGSTRNYFIMEAKQWPHHRCTADCRDAPTDWAFEIHSWAWNSFFFLLHLFCGKWIINICTWTTWEQ